MGGASARSRRRERSSDSIYTESMATLDPTRRFSDRVENYILSRPSYPPEVLETMRQECGMSAMSEIADVACGTGIFTRLLLENGNRVFGVEPNREMREAAVRLLGSYPKFEAIDASAEFTTLPDHSVDFVTAAQAAHWFDLLAARREFTRILKPGGWVVLIWNQRITDSTEFLRSYEKLLLTFATDYEKVRHERTTEGIDGFFAPSPYQVREFPMPQSMDYPSLERRLLSSSYVPLAGHGNYAPMLSELRRLFEATQVNGRVSIDYTTRMYFAQLT
jgi:SAM-dependent methyltransferase